MPLTLSGEETLFRELSGVSAEIVARVGKVRFREAALFTHRGLSGPAVLQASSFWRRGEAIEIDLAPEVDLKLFQIGRDVQVVHPEIMPPTGKAMGLIYNEPRDLSLLQQTGKRGRTKRFRSDIQQVDPAILYLLQDFLPLQWGK